MTEADRKKFGQAMLVLGETFNEPVSEVRVEAYFSALSDLSMASVASAMRGAVKALKFFPKPVEIREMVLGNSSDNADAAWGEVLQQVRRVGYIGTPTFTDARTLSAVTDVWGSWQRMCETLPGEGPELVGWVKQFKAAYASQAPRDERKLLTKSDLAPNVRAFIDAKQKTLPKGIM